MLKESISKTEKQMQSKLEDIRGKFKNSGNKGSGTENLIREFLREYLPRRYEVGHGEITDSFETQSGQVDVIIATENHPFTVIPSEPSIYFVDGIGAAGEIKTTLNTSHLEQALENTLKYKKLKVTHQKQDVIIGDLKKNSNSFSPPYFIFAFESELVIDTIFTKIRTFQKENSLSTSQLPDGIFTLDRGSLINTKGWGLSHDFYSSPNRKNTHEWHHTPLDTPLFDFLAWLTVVMPRTLRMNPILIPYLWKNRQITN